MLHVFYILHILTKMFKYLGVICLGLMRMRLLLIYIFHFMHDLVNSEMLKYLSVICIRFFCSFTYLVLCMTWFTRRYIQYIQVYMYMDTIQLYNSGWHARQKVNHMTENNKESIKLNIKCNIYANYLQFIAGRDLLAFFLSLHVLFYT